MNIEVLYSNRLDIYYQKHLDSRHENKIRISTFRNISRSHGKCVYSYLKFHWEQELKKSQYIYNTQIHTF